MNVRSLVRCCIVLGILVLTLMVSGVVLAQQPSPQVSTGADWLHFGYDSTYTGRNPLENIIAPSNVSKLLRAWGIGCDEYGYYGSTSQSPAIWNGRLFTTTSDTTTLNLLTAYDARSGAKLWQFGKATSYAPQPVLSEDGILFYMEDSYPTSLYAIDAITGHSRWKFFTGLNLGYTDETLVTVDQAKGRIYFVEMPSSGIGGKLWAANKQNGSVAWMMDKADGSYDFKGAHVLLQSGKIYAAARMTDTVVPHIERDRMVRIDTTSKSVDFIYNRPAPGDTSDYSEIRRYVLCNDMLVVAYSDNGYPVKKVVVAGYNLVSATAVWTKTMPSELTGEFACNAAKNLVYVPTDPSLYALTATKGAQVWKYTGFGAIRTPSVANGILYFMSLTNMLAINEDTRHQLFIYPLGQTAGETVQVAIANGALFFTPGGTGATCGLFALGFPPPLFLPIVRRN